jgi:translation initiation factor 6 (eIF-6)
MSFLTSILILPYRPALYVLSEGNCVVCNDHVALVHTDIDRETEDIIADVLGVEVIHLTDYLADYPIPSIRIS